MFCFQSLEWLNPLKGRMQVLRLNGPISICNPSLTSKCPTGKRCVNMCEPSWMRISHWAPFSVHCKHPYNLEFLKEETEETVHETSRFGVIRERGVILKNPHGIS